MSLAYINPGNVDPEEMSDGNLIYSKDICERVPGFFKAMAICFLVLGIIAAALVKRNPDYV